ncbi:GNAT family N-acetyltransferase [Pedobacter duraquae]|uniref:Acetyltransferase (GNAT) family protein n=1 Tax=Pedobacter duraquae TaxID=425511 RepID=A0A4V3C345_9SPHI|nr:GNAT family N-acetyltransferase [Pedobacter duraquae]TDO20679.1 acetyltransferase (GNAT) family protein [Pedobacter duraquae]
MTYREALISDIKNIQIVRNAVKENMLSDPALVTDADCEEFMTIRGKGWVCESSGEVLGFSIIDLEEHNVWALFVHPDDEGKGIGKKLHQLMMDWYFKQTEHTIWLGTGFNTRAVEFYRRQGWKEAGTHGSKEIKFEMSFDNYKLINQLS